MKICIVANNLNPRTGWGRLVSNVGRELKKLGYEVGYIIEKGEEEANVLVAPLKLDLSSFFTLGSSLMKSRRFLADYDVVICYDINPYAIAISLATLGMKKKLVAYAIATYSLLTPGHYIKNMLMRWAYGRADAVWTVSDFVNKQIEKSGYKIKNCQIVPVGVEISFFKKFEAQNASVIAFPYILSVGALKYRKGFHLSIPAFALIAREFPDLKYFIIGDQDMSYARRMRALAEELGVSERVIFLEKISDEELAKYYRFASLFVLTPVTFPGALEGFGMVYLEAGASGKPVIGTLDSGAEAAIVDGFNGLLVPPEAEKIAEAMRKILNNEELASFLGDNGPKRAAEFDWTKIAALQVKNLQKVLNS